MNKTYAGIGSRNTPDSILNLMQRVAKRLEERGYKLNSGGAEGADKAFASGCTNKVIYIPWKGFVEGGIVACSTEAMHMASKYHPAWYTLSQGAKKLMARNMYQILGDDLKTPVDFVICWTPDGAETKTTSQSGGTGQAIRLAIDYNIPVFNLYHKDALNRLTKVLLDAPCSEYRLYPDGTLVHEDDFAEYDHQQPYYDDFYLTRVPDSIEDEDAIIAYINNEIKGVLK